MLTEALKQANKIVNDAVNQLDADIDIDEISTIESISGCTAEVSGLKSVKMEELLTFPNGVQGMAFTLSKDNVGVVFLDEPKGLKAGDRVTRTGRVVDVPVGDALLGRVIDPLGKPLDGLGDIKTDMRMPIEREAFPIMARLPVSVPLQTGIKAIDSFTPIGRGQRELILGDRQSGKTALAVDTIINQKETGVISIYCAIAQRGTAIARVVDNLKKYGVLQNSIIVAAEADETAGMQYAAPYAAAAIGEYFMQKGKDVLVIYDDLTAHARAYREVSLLLRRPPGREAFPGDIFYIHSRLLERSTRLKPELGGGSLTALPIVETEAGNISAYIPTNIISITDGQVYLSSSMFQKGILPAIDTGRSVSRVGGDAQLPAYSSLVGPLKLSFSQFEELESFAKFRSSMDEETAKQLKRGRAIRSVMKQKQFEPMDVVDQIAILTATVEGLLDDVVEADRAKAYEVIISIIHGSKKNVADMILARQKLSKEVKADLISTLKNALLSANLIKVKEN
ncbi:MAG: F0F1 ATP synthase subunit alpha [Alphaproteobacteria bacterium]|nr:F0F1 ATP synthase subunit alpha [Alphaproteobacteria bacterium]